MHGQTRTTSSTHPYMATYGPSAVVRSVDNAKRCGAACISACCLLPGARPGSFSKPHLMMITPALFSGIGTARAHTPSALFFPPAHFSGLTASSQPGPVPTVCSAAPRASSLLRSDPPRGGPVKPTTVIHPSIPLQTPAWQRSAVQFRCRATGRLVRPGHVDRSYSCPRCGHAGRGMQWNSG